MFVVAQYRSHSPSQREQQSRGEEKEEEDQRCCCHEGEVGVRLGLAGVPETAETVAIATSLLLVEQTGAQVHYSQISSARSVELIRQAQQQGLPVTAGVAIHQLLFTESSIEGFNSTFHLQPPLRTEHDRRALIEGVIDGTISAICSDHQPQNVAAKMAPFAATEPGISGLQTFLPLTMKLFHGKMPLPEVVERLTLGPAAIIDQPGTGLELGSSADLTIFDPKTSEVLGVDGWLSRGMNNPFLGQTLNGKVVATFLEGKQVFG